MTGTSLQSRLLHTLVVAAFAVVAAPTGTAIAQDDSEEIEEIVVKGFAGSLRQSLAVKRSENGVVDSIIAEDIADFPDLNLAESIQRIPGVSINRMNGEGRQITVRGLTGNFNRIRINGMEAQNTSGGTDSSGGSNRGRDFDFNTFASELFSGITVRKTASASVEEGSVGATIDLQTSRPFDYDNGLTVATSVQGGYNDLSEEINPRLAGLVSYRSDDDKFGAMMSLAYSDRKILEEGFSTVRWDDGNYRSVEGVDCGLNPADPGCTSINGSSLTYGPRIPRYGRLTHEQQRLGVTGALQFRPSDKTEIIVEGLYSDFDAQRDEEFLEVFFRSQQGSIDAYDVVLDPSKNIIESGTFDISPLSNGTHPVRSEHRFDELNTTFSQITAKLTHDFSDRFRMNVLAGTTNSEQDVPVQTTILYDAVGLVSGYSYDFGSSHQTPSISFGDLDVTDPASFAFTEFRDRPQYVENSFSNLAADVAFDLNENLTIRGGLSYKEFEFDTTESRRESTNGSRLCDAGYYDCDLDDDGIRDITGAPLTPELVTMVSGFGSGLGGSGYDGQWISANVQAAADLIGIYSIPGAPQVGNIRSVTEEDVGGWVQLDFSTELGSIGVRGDIGVRYVETTTTSQGLVVDDDTGDQIVLVDGGDYTDTLPSMNLVFDLTDDFLVRLAYADVMARPSLGDLTPGGSLNSFVGPPYAYDAGNPDLDPYRSTNFDISLEWYFMDDALVSLTYFTKDVDSFFQDSDPVIVPYSQSGLPENLPPASSPLFEDLNNGLDPLIEISQTLNGGNAKVDGFEIIYQQPIGENFGFTGNYTKVDSNEIVGFSENAFNATVYFENDTFSARVSAAYRDPYVTTRANSSGRNERGYDATTNIDLAMAYNLNDSMALTFEALNLTDEYEHQLYDAADLVSVYHHTGTEFILGFRWAPSTK
ncbi:MAG: TonB-dependent receptor [Woeseiaceae bacterium]